MKAGEGVTGLKGGVGKALTKLAEWQTRLGDTTGSHSAAAQKELYASWKKHVSDVSGRREALGGLCGERATICRSPTRRPRQSWRSSRWNTRISSPSGQAKEE